VRKLMVFMIVGLSTAGVFGMTGCAATKSSVQEQSAKAVPPSSKFAKISKGMSLKQVTDLIGHATDMEASATGKAYNPFYFGSDTVHMMHYYKGEGRIETDSRDMVVEIEYDPSESGYKKN